MAVLRMLFTTINVFYPQLLARIRQVHYFVTVRLSLTELICSDSKQCYGLDRVFVDPLR